MKVDPQSGDRVLYPDGRYGDGGEAQLQSIRARPMPGDSNAGKYYVSFPTVIDHPEYGRLITDVQAIGPTHTQMEKGTGSCANQFLANVGLNADMVEFSDEPDDAGNHPLEGPNPCPMKVIVDIGINTYKDKKTGEKVSRNFIKGIAALG
jgi:hypothetical protein